MKISVLICVLCVGLPAWAQPFVVIGTSGSSQDQAVWNRELEARFQEFENLDFRLLIKSHDPEDQYVWERFSEVFSDARSGSGVLEFLQKRIRYLVTGGVLELRSVTPLAPIDLSGMMSELVAINIGAILFKDTIRFGADVQFKTGDAQWQSARTPRVGLIGLAPAFLQQNTFEQLSTLVHEARHSDCTGGLSEEAKETLNNPLTPLSKANEHFSRRSRCGQGHLSCPPDHALAGLAACDLDPWGAYGVEAIFLDANLKNFDLEQASGKKHQTEESRVERSRLAMAVLTAYSRLVNIEPADMRRGKLGKVDLSSPSVE